MIRSRQYWRGYGYCNTCNAKSQQPCKGRFRSWPCKGRETYEHFCDRWSLILTAHYGYTILPEEVPKYDVEMDKNNGY